MNTMNGKLVFGILILIIIVFSGCVKELESENDKSIGNTILNETTDMNSSDQVSDDEGESYEPDNSTSLAVQNQLEKFYEAGCVNVTLNSYDYLDCENSEVISNFSCGSTNLMPLNLEAKELDLLFVRCLKDARYINNSEWGSYFSCGGGLSPVCKGYVTWENGNFIYIKNSSDLLKRILPIDTKQKAINYASISNNAGIIYKVKDKEFKGKVEKKGSNFLVTLFTLDSGFGCYDRMNYYRVQYEVTPEGTITEKSVDTVYTDLFGYTICVD